MDRMLVITNAAAGSVDDEAAEQALAVLRESGDVVVVATSDRDELVETLAERDGRDVIVMGGDGSLHATVSVLHELDDLDGPTIGLIPMGTGNDFARNFELPEDPEEAARVIVAGVPRTLDLIVDDTGQVVVNAVHLGIGVDAGRESARLKKRLGKLGYVIGALTAGVRSPGLRVRVVADDVVVADGHSRVLQVAVTNGAYLGGGAPIAPDACVDDGVAEVVVSFAVSALPRVVYGLLMRLGRHGSDDNVTMTRATRVVVTGKPFRTNNDGELEDPGRRRVWTVRPAAYRLIVPAS